MHAVHAILAVWSLAAVAVPVAAGARPNDDAPPAPPVDDLVREALARSPSVAAAQARVQAARQRIGPAAALPDPMLEGMYQNVGAATENRMMSMGQVQYTQPLPWPGRLRARAAAASAEADLQAAEGDDVRRTLVMQVRSAYARLYEIDRESESLGTARELLDVLAAIARARYATGQGEQEAIVKAQLERSRLEERDTDLQARRAAWVSVLNRLLDRPAGSRLGPVAALPEPGAPEDVVGRALQRSPELRMRSAAVEASARRLDEARLASRPGFLVGLGVGSTLAPEAVVVLRFGVELPVWRSRKTDPAIEAARADLAAAEADLRAAEAGVRTDAERLVARWRRDQAQLVRYREAIVPQSALALDAARASYLAGRGDFATVVEDFRSWLDARVQLAGREADRLETWAEIDKLTAPAAGPEAAGGDR